VCPQNVTCSGYSTPVIANNSANLGNIFYSSLNVQNSDLVLNNFVLKGDLWTSKSVYTLNGTTIDGNANFYDSGLTIGSTVFITGTVFDMRKNIFYSF